MKNLFKREPVTLWHPASPGVKVTVRRNWFERKLKSKHFATLGECIKATDRYVSKKRKKED